MNSSFFSDLLTSISDRGRELLDTRRDRPEDMSQIGSLCQALLSERGEASGVALAADILSAYSQADDEQKSAFFDFLTNEFGADKSVVDDAIETYREAPSEQAAFALHLAAEPRRQELIRRLNLAPGGTAALVAIRSDLLALRKPGQWRALDLDFRHLFRSWFNRGFLVLRRIDWQTPAAILERIIKYEAVHAIDDWEDLRRRIDPGDRRLYAFFHPAMVDEPLIFVEVALERDIPGAIAPILASERVPISTKDASTAVFYSISNCQTGLRGISFGHFLIKQVVEELARDFPNLKTFVTLSPIPGFAAWLKDMAADDDRPHHESAAALFVQRGNAPGWPLQRENDDKLRRTLSALAADYLINETAGESRAADPVARFHLSNGARLERINWFADQSEKGLRHSFGMMVNYRYDLKDIERNHEAFANDGIIAASSTVQRQAKSLGTSKKPASAPA